jgi:hypothetical protein
LHALILGKVEYTDWRDKDEETGEFILNPFKNDINNAHQDMAIAKKFFLNLGFQEANIHMIHEPT